MGEIFGWFGRNPWAIWLSLSLVLAAFELLTTDLTLLMLASGALAGALAALVAPSAAVVQLLVAIVVSTMMLAVLRPTLLRRIQRAPGYVNALTRLVGSVGTATQRVTKDDGEVRINGELWSARAAAGDVVIDPGAKVEVYEVDGTTLLVYPRDLPVQWKSGPAPTNGGGHPAGPAPTN